MTALLALLADDLFFRLTASASPTIELLRAGDADEAVERLARAYRIDAVVTDDAAAVRAIRDEIPGDYPVVLLGSAAPSAISLPRDATLARIVAALEASAPPAAPPAAR